MLKPGDALRFLEEQDELATYGHLTYAQALERYERLWRHARSLRPDIGSDWQDDLQADLAVARAINGLPPAG